MKGFLFINCLGLIAFSLQAQDWNAVTIKTISVSGNIYMLEGSGGNIGLSVGDDGVLMIDSQFRQLSDKILFAIKGLSDGQVKYLLNTHWHGDHVGGNENFAAAGAVIVGHENVKRRMSAAQVRPFMGETPAAQEEAIPLVTFTDRLGLKFNGEYLILAHVGNAHTDGDVLIYFPESNVLHMGDIYFKDRFPFIDLSSGGSINGFIKAVDHAIFLSDSNTKIIPGHGSLSNRTELLDYRNMLQRTRDWVMEEIKEGKSLEEMKTMMTSGDHSYVWGMGFDNPDRFLDAIYSSLTENGSL